MEKLDDESWIGDRAAIELSPPEHSVLFHFRERKQNKNRRGESTTTFVSDGTAMKNTITYREQQRVL